MYSPAKRLLAAGLTLAACAFIPAGLSAGVVISASGPSAGSFPAGRKIGDSERIALRAGDTLTVLDGKGTRVLRGAGTFSLDQQTGPARSGTFAVLTERRSAQRTALAASRADELPNLAPSNLWYVDISQPGTTCLADTARVRLWRGMAEGEASYAISAGGKSQTVAFSDGGVLATWDQEALPIAAGTDYAVSGGGTLRFVMLAPAAEEPEALAAQLIENGCTRQLEVLSAAMMIPEA